MGIVVDLLCPCTHSLARWLPHGTFTSAPLTWGDPTTALLRITLTCYPVTIVLFLLAAKSWLVRARARRLHRLAQAAGSVAAVLDVSSSSPPRPSSIAPATAATAPVPDTATHQHPPPALLVCTKCHDSRRAPPPAHNPDRKRTGELLYDTLASPGHPTLSPLVSAGKLQILPVKCLANCDAANCIALSATDKFTYQFTALCATDQADIEDIASFAGYYATGRYCAGEDEVVGVEDAVAMTKVKTRPRGLKSNCVARIPPLVGPGRDMLLGSAPRLPPAPIEESELEVGKEPEGEPEVAIALELDVGPNVVSVVETVPLPPTPPDSQLHTPPQQSVHNHPHQSRSMSASPCATSAASVQDDGFRLVRSRRRRRARTPSRKATTAKSAVPAW